MDTNEIPGELSLGNTISSQLKMTHFFFTWEKITVAMAT